MDLNKTISDFFSEQFEDQGFFIVELNVKGQNGGKVKIQLLLDKEDGLGIDDCSTISRRLGAYIEENDLIQNAYTLEVGSPGIDHPLVDFRQYKKNIGRKVAVETKEGEKFEGELLEVAENEIIVGLKEKKSKELMKKHLELSSISETKVLVSF